MYLLAGGSAYGVSYLERDDDGPGLNSRIARWLNPGVYTIVATTYGDFERDDYTLEVQVID